MHGRWRRRRGGWRLLSGEAAVFLCRRRLHDNYVVVRITWVNHVARHIAMLCNADELSNPAGDGSGTSKIQSSSYSKSLSSGPASMSSVSRVGISSSVSTYSTRLQESAWTYCNEGGGSGLFVLDNCCNKLQIGRRVRLSCAHACAMPMCYGRVLLACAYASEDPTCSNTDTTNSCAMPMCYCCVLLTCAYAPESPTYSNTDTTNSCSTFMCYCHADTWQRLTTTYEHAWNRT